MAAVLRGEARQERRFLDTFKITVKYRGGVAQLGEHLPCTQGVRSSILLISTKTSERSDEAVDEEKRKPEPLSDTLMNMGA